MFRAVQKQVRINDLSHLFGSMLRLNPRPIFLLPHAVISLLFPLFPPHGCGFFLFVPFWLAVGVEQKLTISSGLLRCSNPDSCRPTHFRTEQSQSFSFGLSRASVCSVFLLKKVNNLTFTISKKDLGFSILTPL